MDSQEMIFFGTIFCLFSQYVAFFVSNPEL